MKLLQDLYSALLAKYGKIDASNFEQLNNELQQRIINPIKTLKILGVTIKVETEKAFFLKKDFEAVMDSSDSRYYAKSGKTHYNEKKETTTLNKGWHGSDVVFYSSFVGYGFSPLGESFVAHSSSYYSSMENKENFYKEAVTFENAYIHHNDYHNLVSIDAKGNGIGNRPSNELEIKLKFRANLNSEFISDLDLDNLQKEFNAWIAGWQVAEHKKIVKIWTKGREGTTAEELYNLYKEQCDTVWGEMCVDETTYKDCPIAERIEIHYKNGQVHHASQRAFAVYTHPSVRVVATWSCWSDCENIFIEYRS